VQQNCTANARNKTAHQKVRNNITEQKYEEQNGEKEMHSRKHNAQKNFKARLPRKNLTAKPGARLRGRIAKQDRKTRKEDGDGQKKHYGRFPPRGWC